MMPSHMGAFKGDGEHLVDMLVEACAAKTHNSPLAGYGRELIPCADAWLTAGDRKMGNTARNSNNSRATSSPKQGRNAAGRTPASPFRAARAAQQDLTKAAPASKNNASGIKRCASYTDPSSPIAIPSTNQFPIRGTASPRAPQDAGAYLCPAVAASPKPEALPMPTTGLLTRVASRGRSPSPSKVAAAMYSVPEPCFKGMMMMTPPARVAQAAAC